MVPSRLPPEYHEVLGKAVEEGLANLLQRYRCWRAARAGKSPPVRANAPCWLVLAAYGLFGALLACLWACMALFL